MGIPEKDLERAWPVHVDDNGEWMPYVSVTDATVTFVGQRGPRRLRGENGCDVDRIVQFARIVLQQFQRRCASRETALAITKLEEAEMWLERRTRDRVARGVEGTYDT